jgi:hypothetical protein
MLPYPAQPGLRYALGRIAEAVGGRRLECVNVPSSGIDDLHAHRNALSDALGDGAEVFELLRAPLEAGTLSADFGNLSTGYARFSTSGWITL